MSEELNPPHNGHPMRHWDRTCPACIAEAAAGEVKVALPTGARKKVERGIGALLQGAVSMGYVLDALDALEAEAAERERERCAALCESLVMGEFTPSTSLSPQESERIEFVTRSTAQQLAEAIRRGK